MASSVEIKGLAELHKTLQELPAKIERNVLRGGLRAGAKVLEEAARSQVPVKQGDLRKSIRVSMRVSSKTGIVRAQVKAGDKKAWYAHLVEFGTARHWIKPKNRKSLFVAGLFKEVIDHPGAKKKPFMRPAFDGKWRAAIDAMADYIRTRLPKELGRARK
jgi:HK97 gp10 family phage protein